MLASPYVQHASGRPNTDFGRGFYTTTLEHQARQWAWLQHYSVPLRERGKSGNQPVAMWFRVEWLDIAKLQSLALSISDHTYDPYWSLVFHCRSSPPAGPANDHCRAGASSPWYDMISGPVAAMWRQRVAMPDTDQYSFHTADGVSVFNHLIVHGTQGQDYDIMSVP